MTLTAVVLEAGHPPPGTGGGLHELRDTKHQHLAESQGRVAGCYLSSDHQAESWLRTSALTRIAALDCLGIRYDLDSAAGVPYRTEAVLGQQGHTSLSLSPSSSTTLRVGSLSL